MGQVLSLAYRPRTFAQMVGAGPLIKKIREQYASGREPIAWMFDGQTGGGKTTLARIMAVALQCTHQEKFGNPCIDCRRAAKKFDITEVNASLDNKRLDFEQAITGWNYNPRPPSRRRVYILDEVQKITDSAQNLLLKILEPDRPSKTVFFLCTTEPEAVLPAIQRRCVCYTVPPLEIEDVRKLIDKAFAYLGEDRDSEELSETLLEAGVSSPGLVVAAVEKYLAGASAAEAVLQASGNVDAIAICKAVKQGDWYSLARQLEEVPDGSVRALRQAVMTYLMKILLGDKDYSDRGEVVKRGIMDLASAANMGQRGQLAALTAVLYTVSQRFQHQKR